MSKNRSKTEDLLAAARNGRIAEVQELLRSKVNVELKGDDGRTALMNAAGSHHFEVVKILLAAKANVHVASNGGDTALSYALKADWAGLFTRSKNSTDAVFGTVRALLAGGAKINEAILQFAIADNSTDIAKALLKATRDVATIHAALAGAKSMEYDASNDPQTLKKNYQLVAERLRELTI